MHFSSHKCLQKKKKIMYGHSSQLSSQKLLQLQPLNNMGASSLLPPLQEVYSQFQVLCLKYSPQREVKSMHLSAKLSEKPFETGTSRKTAFGFTLSLSKVQDCVPLPGLVPPGPAGHGGIVFVPPPVHLLQRAVDHSTGFPVDLTVEKRSPIGSIQKVSQLHLCKSMFRAYSIRFFNSNEQPDISRVVSLNVVDILSSLM